MKVKKARGPIAGILFFKSPKQQELNQLLFLLPCPHVTGIRKDWLRIPYEVQVNCLLMWYLSKSLKGYRKTQLIHIYTGRELSMQPGLQMGHYFDLCVDVVLILNTQCSCAVLRASTKASSFDLGQRQLCQAFKRHTANIKIISQNRNQRNLVKLILSGHSYWDTQNTQRFNN